MSVIFIIGWVSYEGVVRRFPRGRRPDPVRLSQPHRRRRRRARGRPACSRPYVIPRIPYYIPWYTEGGKTKTISGYLKL